ncbi:trehalase [Phellopilus nigrolimitatus]|nr:trehalase [Phellopilus nigrolimitatus]
MRGLRALSLAAVALSTGLGVSCLPQASPSPSSVVPSITLSTTVPSPTVPLTDDLPSQAALPMVQAWCPSEIFCAGSLLQTVNIASLYSDPKTFVDKPTNFSSAAVLSTFNSLVSSAGNSTTNITEQQIVDFVDTNFRGEGLELEAQALSDFIESPSFLENVADSMVKAWAQTVSGFWTQLIRGTNDSTLCGEGTNGGSCESTLIPLNHTFVVPGGRFREQYYWDSYWIIMGLIESQLLNVVNATLQNFMDELDKFGFIPNGGRIYYLNRSQPPLFIHMLREYVRASNDTSILARALPLAERELEFWHTNRTLNVTSPFTHQTYEVSRYAVNNTAPRPESYLTDYITANGDGIATNLNDSQKADLFAEIATGAETGWDFTVRFFKEPLAGGTNDTDPGMRTLNVRSTIPVCLNSILYKAHIHLAELYSSPIFDSQNTTAKELVTSHNTTAENLRAAILDLFWDPTKLAFYDFNLTSNDRNSIFTAAHFYPMWSGIIPDELLANETAAFGAFASINMVMNKYNGTFPSTFIESGQQWDAPNAWPPHQFIALGALANLPANISTTPVPSPPSGHSSYSLIPAGQLGIDESALPGQQLAPGVNASVGVDPSMLNGTVVNGGNATADETWTIALQRELANRYISSALCSWHATGGSIAGVLNRLSDAELNVTQSTNNTGNMFEKFSISDVDSSGQGGEYTVQAGFGWTNGVALWVASNYGKILVAPSCPDLLAGASGTGNSAGSNSGSTSSALRVDMSTRAPTTILFPLLIGAVFAVLA